MEEITLLDEVKQKYGDIALNIKDSVNCCCNLDTVLKDDVACWSKSDSLPSNKEGIHALGRDKNIISYANSKLGEHGVDPEFGSGKDAISISSLTCAKERMTGFDFTEEMIGYAYGQIKERRIKNISFKIGNVILPVVDLSSPAKLL